VEKLTHIALHVLSVNMLSPISLASIIVGFVAKTVASGVFVSNRSEESIRSEDLSRVNTLVPLVRFQVHRQEKRVSAHLLGLGRRDAIFRPGLGCTLVGPGEMLRPSALEVPPSSGSPHEGNGLKTVRRLDDARAGRLERLIDGAFKETRRKRVNTRAVLVVKCGVLVAERYGNGIDVNTRLCGQSLSKTVFGALIGILAERGLIDLDGPAPVREWHLDPADPRGAITVRDLLTMTSGLQWSEDPADPASDVITMLFRVTDMAAFAEAKPLASPPGETFTYNSGNTLILSKIIRTALGNDREAYLRFPQQALFEPAGMTSAVVETDATDNFVASSSVYACARDWARFGQLFLDGGRAGQNQVLPEIWPTQAATPSPTSPGGCYGAQTWLNAGSADGQRPRPSLPSDLLLMNGTFGQFVAVLPADRLVIVRLGDTRDWDIDRDPDPFISAIRDAVS
jgi:CubicO group peptidase (beta-lactamase class C family)